MTWRNRLLAGTRGALQDIRLVTLMPFRRLQRREVRRSYVVCATPRSGSTLICDYLIRSGRAGFPSEWLLRDLETKYRAWFGQLPPVHDPHHLEAVVRRTTTANGVFGMKTMWPELENLIGRLPGSDGDPFTKLKRALPHLRLIHVSRGDKVRQAISHLIARETGRWHLVAHALAGAPSPTGTARPLETPEQRRGLYRELRRLEDEISSQEDRWESFFRFADREPLRVTYEGFVTDPEASTVRILDYLGAGGPRSTWSDARRFERLSDERNEAYLRIYREEAESEATLERR